MITQAAIGSLVNDFTSTFFKRTGNVLNDLQGELSHFLNDGLTPYLEKQKNKYSNIKTLLHRNVPVYFYDIYQPLNLSYDSKIFSTDSINNVFIPSQFITIVGDAGSGKSTLIKHLFLNAISERFSIPILVELRYLNEYSDSLETFLKERIFENKLAKNSKILERLLQNGKFVFFLDGFDEIRSDNKQKVIANINSFIDKYRTNRFLLTSRPHSNIEMLPMFHNCTINSLKLNEIKLFVFRQKIESELAKKLVKSIEESENKHIIKEYLTNPLLLSLYILTFSTNSSIPNKKYLFYRRVLDVLFKEHDSISKIGYDREVLTRLNQDQFEEILQAFSFVSYLEAEFDFEKDYLNNTLNKIKDRLHLSFSNHDFIDDLKSAIALWTEDSGIVSFAHRSMQEYFAALYIKNVSSTKGKIYEKIQDKVLQGKSRHLETGNFIGLCDEMDKYGFRKYLYLPALRKLREQFVLRSVNTKVASVLKCLYEELHLEIDTTDKRRIMMTMNKDSIKFVFTIAALESRLIHAMFKVSPDPIFRDVAKKHYGHNKVAKQKNMFVVSFQKPIHTELLNFIKTTEIKVVVLEMVDYIRAEISKTEDFIKQSSLSEKSLLDLV